MVPTEELRSAAVPSSMADLRDIPLAEMSALGLDVLGSVIGRALPGGPANLAPMAAFQSSI
jgi:FXSXX-COOH protein